MTQSLDHKTVLKLFRQVLLGHAVDCSSDCNYPKPNSSTEHSQKLKAGQLSGRSCFFQAEIPDPHLIQHQKNRHPPTL